MPELSLFQYMTALALASSHGHEWAVAMDATDSVPNGWACVRGGTAPSAWDLWVPNELWHAAIRAMGTTVPGMSETDALDAAGVPFQRGMTSRVLGELASEYSPYTATTEGIARRTHLLRDLMGGDPGIEAPSVDEQGHVVHATGSGRLTWDIGPEECLLTVWRPDPERPAYPEEGHDRGVSCLAATYRLSAVEPEITVGEGYSAAPCARHVDALYRALACLPRVGPERAREALAKIVTELGLVEIVSATGARGYLDPREDIPEGWTVRAHGPGDHHPAC